MMLTEPDTVNGCVGAAPDVSCQMAPRSSVANPRVPVDETLHGVAVAMKLVPEAVQPAPCDARTTLPAPARTVTLYPLLLMSAPDVSSGDRKFPAARSSVRTGAK